MGGATVVVGIGGMMGSVVDTPGLMVTGASVSVGFWVMTGPVPSQFIRRFGPAALSV